MASNPEEDEPMPPNEDDKVDDDDDDEPAFIDPSTAVEVDIADDVEPMDSDSEAGDGDGGGNDFIQNSTEEPIIDMSILRFDCHSDSVFTVAIDPATGAIVSGGGDDKAFLSKRDDGTSSLLDHSHTDSVSCAKFNSHCGSVSKRLLAVGSYDGNVVLYDEDGKKVAVLEGMSDVEWIDWHPNGGTILLAGSTDGTIWMYHTPIPSPPNVMQVFVGHQNDVTCGRFAPDGKFVVSCGADATMRIWAPKTGLCKHVYRERFATSPITCMDAKSDVAMVGCEDGMCYVVGLGSGEKGSRRILTHFRHFEGEDDGGEGEGRANSVEAVGFYTGEHSNWCASGGADGFLKIWDLNVPQGGRCRQSCDHDNAVITKLKWHPTKPIIFTAANDGKVRLWDARTGTCGLILTGHTDTINDMDIDFGNEKVLIVTGSDDNTVRLFEVDVNAVFND